MHPIFAPADPGLPLLDAPPIPWRNLSQRIADARTLYVGQNPYLGDPDIADPLRRAALSAPRHFLTPPDPGALATLAQFNLHAFGYVDEPRYIAKPNFPNDFTGEATPLAQIRSALAPYATVILNNSRLDRLADDNHVDKLEIGYLVLEAPTCHLAFALFVNPYPGAAILSARDPFKIPAAAHDYYSIERLRGLRDPLLDYRRPSSVDSSPHLLPGVITPDALIELVNLALDITAPEPPSAENRVIFITYPHHGGARDPRIASLDVETSSTRADSSLASRAIIIDHELNLASCRGLTASQAAPFRVAARAMAPGALQLVHHVRFTDTPADLGARISSLKTAPFRHAYERRPANPSAALRAAAHLRAPADAKGGPQRRRLAALLAQLRSAAKKPTPPSASP